MPLEEQLPAQIVPPRALKQHLFSLLECCTTLRKLTEIHTQLIVNGFSNKNFLLAKLLSFYITTGCLFNAVKVFHSIQTPTTAVWNQLIRGHGERPSKWKSMQVYNRMREADAVPDQYTYSYLLSACLEEGLWREGKQVHARVLSSGHRSNPFVQTILIKFYSQSEGGHGGMVNAHKAFDEMSERNVYCWNTILGEYVRRRDMDAAHSVFRKMPEKNVVSWTTMIAGCARNGECRTALSLFSRMQETEMELDQVVLIPVLSACAELGNLKLGQQIHSYILQKFCSRNDQVLVSLNNSIMHMYASCGLIDEAYNVLRHMRKRTTVSWTSIITGFAKQGLADEALSIFDMMLNWGAGEAKPDGITFIGVLVACCHAGYVDEGRQYFEFMRQTCGIEPRMEHYGCMVDLLSRSGCLEEAHQLIESMPMKPNDVTWGALLGGCRTYKNVDITSLVSQNLMAELNPEIAAGYLSLLSDIYAAAERWQDVADLRRKMVEMGVKKPAGRSWVQVDRTVHDFVAGDETHKHSALIYELLGQLIKEAKGGNENDPPDLSVECYSQ